MLHMKSVLIHVILHDDVAELQFLLSLIWKVYTTLADNNDVTLTQMNADLI